MTSAPDPTALVLGHIAEYRGTAEDEWTTGPVTELGHRLYRLSILSAVIKGLADAIEETLVAEMETNIVDLPGVGRLHRDERVSSTWRNENSAEALREELARAVATIVATDVATGDVNSERRNIALATMRTAYEAIPSFSSVKSAGRKRLGIDIGDYRTYARHYTVTVEAVEDQG